MPLTRRALLATTAAAIAARGASAQEIEARPQWANRFRDVGTEGVFVVRRARRGSLLASDEQRARRAYLPASTFKIPNSLIAIETGVVADADHPTFGWDGVTREFEAWNRDHTLRSAFKASAVPVYQEIARRIGPERMARYVAQFDYGNRDTSGEIDGFWLRGRLRISAAQQAAFLERLYAEELPLERRTQTIVKDIMLLDESDLGVLRGKTGAVGLEQGGQASLGWLVGWLERVGDAYVFALNLDIREREHLARRLPLVKALLRDALAV